MKQQEIEPGPSDSCPRAATALTWPRLRKRARDIAFLGEPPLMQEPSSPVNPPEVGIRVHKSSETGLPGEPFSLTSLWPSVSRCTSRSLASSTSCIWELRARPRESLWGAERSQLPLCGRVQDSAGLGWPSPPATSTQAWGARSRMCPQGGGSQDNFPGPGNKETEAQRVGGVAPGDPRELAAVSTPHPVCLSKPSLRCWGG